MEVQVYLQAQCSQRRVKTHGCCEYLGKLDAGGCWWMLLDGWVVVKTSQSLVLISPR